MNYYNLRLFIEILIIFILSFLYFKLKFLKIKKYKIEYIISSFIILIIVGFCLTFPIENLWISFETIEDAFNYKYYDYNLVEKYDGKESTIILVNNDNSLYFEEFKKTNNKFKLTNSFFNKAEIKPLNSSCFISKINVDDKYFINISCNKNSNVQITYGEKKELKKLELNNIEYYGIINKNERIFLNEKEIDLNF